MAQARRNTLIALAIATFTSGCPRKLTEKVEVPVPGKCPPAGNAAPPTKSLAAVAVVTQDGKQKAVLASGSWAAVAGVGEPVGTEGATVLDVQPAAVALRLGDGTMINLSVTGDLPGAGVPVPPKPNGDSPAVDAQALGRWRASVLEGVVRGYGVPLDALLAISLALTDAKPAFVAEALGKLGWSALAGIGDAWLTGIKIEGGVITLDGVAPDKRVFEGLVDRLKAASPLLTRVRVVSNVPGPDGTHFQLAIEAPLVKSTDLAVPHAKDTPVDAGSLSEEIGAQLDPLGQKLPTGPQLNGLESELRTTASRSGLTVTLVTRNPDTVEDGYLGVATVAFEASGSTKGLLVFLDALRSGNGSRPLVVDPLDVRGSRITASFRVPYTRGKADVRSPTPGTLILPPLAIPRWEPARNLPMDALRDPFSRP